VAEPLENYYAILRGRRRARYLECRSRKISFSRTVPDEEGWRIHREAMAGRGEVEEAETSLLDLKILLTARIMHRCHLCERRCGVDRTAGERGHCGVIEPRISSDFLHMGEEPPLVPSYTVFFSGCTFDCVFCQNWDISTRPEGGMYLPPEVLADRIERRFRGGEGRPFDMTPRNVNWVGGDPTPNLRYILQVLQSCRANIPQVWNSNMYLSRESMDLLEGVIDVYLTDFKYGSDDCARRLSNVKRYTEVVSRNHLQAAAQGEVIVRHLVMPNHVECCTKPVLDWISEHIPDSLVNVMRQYRPLHLAGDYEDIARPLGHREFMEAQCHAERLGLNLVG